MNNILRIMSPDDYIQEGASPAPSVLLMACTVGDDYDDPKNRILVRKEDTWIDFTSAGEPVLSIDATEDGRAYVLGENGSVIEFDWTARSQQALRASRRLIENTIADSLGPLRRIRILSGKVLCAGSVGQMYQLHDEGFRALPKLQFSDMELTIEDMAGMNVKGMLAVTSEGVGAVYDGTKWENADLPANVKLSSVCALTDNKFAIAGSEGLVMVGRPGRWDILESADTERTYWGVASQNERVYVAHLGGIDVVANERLMPLEIPEAERLEFTVLRSGPDGIWSFAGQTVGLVTADGWRTVIAR